MKTTVFESVLFSGNLWLTRFNHSLSGLCWPEKIEMHPKCEALWTREKKNKSEWNMGFGELHHMTSSLQWLGQGKYPQTSADSSKWWLTLWHGIFFGKGNLPQKWGLQKSCDKYSEQNSVGIVLIKLVITSPVTRCKMEASEFSRYDKKLWFRSDTLL